jgi:hypothetical protein
MERDLLKAFNELAEADSEGVDYSPDGVPARAVETPFDPGQRRDRYPRVEGQLFLRNRSLLTQPFEPRREGRIRLLVHTPNMAQSKARSPGIRLLVPQAL